MQHDWRHACLILAVAGAAAIPATASAAEDQDDPTPAVRERNRDIVVMGYPLTQALVGLSPEDELDESDIAAFGYDNVGELLGEIGGQIDRNEDGPIILINGEPASGLDEITDLPVEAVERIQLLPREAAPRLGESPSRRVVNVVIKPVVTVATVNATGTMASEGEGYQAEGSLRLLRHNSGNRESLGVTVRHIDPLSEADRPIVSLADSAYYDFTGNILPFPLSGDEIDPALSSAAGTIVTVAGVPAGQANPSFADFVAAANRANVSATGSLRTLVSQQDLYSINANITRKLGPGTRLTFNAKYDHGENAGLNGPGTLALRIPASSPFSPFDSDVTLARLHSLLAEDSRSDALNLGSSLNARLGTWQLIVLANADFRWSERRSDSRFDATALQAGITAGTINPFLPIPDDLVDAVVSRSSSDSRRIRLQGSMSGNLFDVRAGSVGLTLRSEFTNDRYSSRFDFGSGSATTKLERSEWNAMANLAVPIFAEDDGRNLGNLDFDVYGSIRQLSVFGTLWEWGESFNWTPVPQLELQLGLRNERVAPSASLLTDPVEIYPNYRVYDFLRDETVLVDYVTGGNPGLKVERQREFTAGFRLSPIDQVNLTLSAEYSRQVNRDSIAYLPPASAEVQAAFPDRYLRDGNGRLIQVDNRAVNFARERQEEIRWGLELRQTLRGGGMAGGGVAGAEEDSDGDGATPLSDLANSWRINLKLFDRWTLRSDRLARTGLPLVDLLDGGASGYGSGLPRHNLEFAAGIGGKGMGLQLTGIWRSPSTIRGGAVGGTSDLRFGAFGTINIRAFVNLGTIFPQSGVAKNARITFNALNLLNTRQTVTDGSGDTPLSYQPWLIDPIGRTFSLSLRKAF